MIVFNQIICPVDFSESSVRALAYAAALARWYDAHLTVLHVVPTFESMQVRGDILEPIRVVTPMPRERVVEEMSRSLNLAALSPRASSVADTGDPQVTIIDQAFSRKADLIVMGTHGRRGFKRLVLGSVTEAVLRDAPCPVLTVPLHATAAVSEAVTFKRILCPVDFSPSALQALGFALDLARQSDGRVTLMRVVEWLEEEEPRAAVVGQLRTPAGLIVVANTHLSYVPGWGRLQSRNASGECPADLPGNPCPGPLESAAGRLERLIPRPAAGAAV